jgi:hypothetical protein
MRDRGWVVTETVPICPTSTKTLPHMPTGASGDPGGRQGIPVRRISTETVPHQPWEHPAEGRSNAPTGVTPDPDSTISVPNRHGYGLDHTSGLLEVGREVCSGRESNPQFHSRSACGSRDPDACRWAAWSSARPATGNGAGCTQGLGQRSANHPPAAIPFTVRQPATSCARSSVRGIELGDRLADDRSLLPRLHDDYGLRVRQPEAREFVLGCGAHMQLTEGVVQRQGPRIWSAVSYLAASSSGSSRPRGGAVAPSDLRFACGRGGGLPLRGRLTRPGSGGGLTGHHPAAPAIGMRDRARPAVDVRRAR